jgi:homoserine kinase
VSSPATSPASLADGVGVRLRVPATSANLGPAFDAAGLALSLYDEVEVRTGAAGCVVEVVGEGADELPRDDAHLVLRAVRAGLEAAGVSQPGLAMAATNRIPHGRGLGSSAAATVAGLVAARELARTVGQASALADDALLGIATTFEGHADNVGATLHGGLTLVWAQAGTQGSVRLDVDSRVHPVVLVPQDKLSTSRARGLIPESVPHRVASFNVARAALLVAALTHDPSLLLAATEDRLHQPYRAGAFPDSMALVESLRAAGFAATISGAGPSVLVLVADDGAGLPPLPDGWAAHHLSVDTGGATVLDVTVPG